MFFAASSALKASFEAVRKRYRGNLFSRVDWNRPCPFWLAFSATAAAVLAGYLIKYQCVVHAWADEFQFRRLCYSDIQALWGVRGIRDGFLPYRDVQFEYPVLTGMFMDLTGRLQRMLARAGLGGVPTHGSFFVLSSILLAPFAFAVTALIRPFVPARRLMVWAAGTPLILYGFMSWDLPAVAAAAWAVAAVLQKRYGWAGVAAAVGASAKLYPIFLLPAFALSAWVERGKQSAMRLILAFGGAYAAINVPWIIISNGASRAPSRLSDGIPFRQPGTNGWLEVWLFHARRGAEFDSIWFWLAENARAFLNFRREPFISTGTTILFVLVSAVLMFSGWRKRSPGGGYPALTVGLGILSAFLVTSKIYSPQYGLWLAPMLALVAVPWAAVAAFLAGDLVVFVSRFYFYTAGADVSSGWAEAFEAGVWLRAAALAAMILWALRNRSPEPQHLGE